jgi:hypothetical protein
MLEIKTEFETAKKSLSELAKSRFLKNRVLRHQPKSNHENFKLLLIRNPAPVKSFMVIFSGQGDEPVASKVLTPGAVGKQNRSLTQKR